MPRRTPFRKILVANRGEIALRVMRSARAHGYSTVAVYSTADAHARHVQEADQAVCIGDALPARSYLNIAALIAAARATGADAVHPGYGFLAENAAFAQACLDAGLVFIGPSPQAIAAMGDKAAAKRLMLQAGVPCVPGYDGAEQDEERLAGEARRIGFPVMIKATAGGGGRGMRLVESPAAFQELLRSARSEAANAFGDPTVILERAIREPRHIEIQVFADRHGNAIHLGERDCSVQRRHQKLIEEAPSPAVSADLRERMGAAAVAAARAIGYEGAGTLEFLLDRHGSFYFMEMNTRLQVEHAVTEAITGLDLVALQLRVAAGDALPLAQSDVRWHGHAIEVRLCAEDVEHGFMPQSGTLALWKPAGGVRVDHALEPGAVVPPYYDSMVAKLVSHGDTREEARRKLARALHETVALGVPTNCAFLARCLEHPVFAAGDATTAFIGDHLQELLRRDEGDDLRAAALAAVLLVETAGGARAPVARRLSHSLLLQLRLEVGGRQHVATITELALHQREVTVDGVRHEVQLAHLAADRVRFVCDGVMESAAWFREGVRLLMLYRGVPYEVIDTSRAASVRAEDAAGDGRLHACMNGRVVGVMVAVGDRVDAGQPMVTVEAMKMEHIHAAPMAGVVKALYVTAGEQVAARRLVAEIEPAPAAD